MKLIRTFLVICAFCMVTTIANADDACQRQPHQELTKQLAKEGFTFKFEVPVVDDISAAQFGRHDGSFVIILIKGDVACIGFKYISSRTYEQEV